MKAPYPYEPQGNTLDKDSLVWTGKHLRINAEPSLLTRLKADKRVILSGKIRELKN